MLRIGKFCATVFVAAVPAASGAATMQAIYTGTVSGSYDMTGLFGRAPGASLDGLAFSLTYTYDTSLGLRYTSATSDEIYGGAGYGAPSPIFSAVLNIGGVAKVIFGTTYSFARQFDGFGYDYLDHYQQEDTYDPQSGAFSQNYVHQWGYDYGDALPINLDLPFSLSGLASTGQFAGAFGFFSYDPVLGGPSTYAFGSLYADTLDVSAVAPAAVPLPAGAGLVVTALAALRGLRSRRARAAVSDI